MSKNMQISGSDELGSWYYYYYYIIIIINKVLIKVTLNKVILGALSQRFSHR